MKRVTLLSGLILALFAGLASAQVTFYDREGMHGRGFTADRAIDNLDPTGFNDRARSAHVERGAWEVCEDAYFQGRCVTLRPGDYFDLNRMGMGNKISSVRPLERYGYGYGRRYEEQRYYDRDRDYYQR